MERRGQVRRIPLRRVIHTEVVPDATDYDQSRVDADTHLEGNAPPLTDRRVVVLEGHLNGKGSLQRARSVVLMSDRRAEQGHPAVTGELINRPLVAVHRLQQQVETAVH